jgi:hypothetical protein
MKGAIVCCSGATGNVLWVGAIPSAASAGAVGGGTPTVVQQGSSLVLQGRFLAVFDAAGKNRAPSGANEVHVDAQTGELISLQ